MYDPHFNDDLPEWRRQGLLEERARRAAMTQEERDFEDESMDAFYASKEREPSQ